MSETLNIAVGCDHAGFELKQVLKQYFREKNIEVKDFGTHSLDSVDYPDFAHPTALCVENKEAKFGILICGSANGVAITANKHAGIRAALCWKNEIAALARQHNDANMLCLPARYITNEEAIDMVNTFLETPFEGGRHQGRVEKISC